MNDTQRNRIRMFKATRDYLTAHDTVWNGIPGNVSAVEALTLKIAELDLLVTQQEKELKGYTMTKATLRDTLEKKILVVANAGAAYARSIGNDLLLVDCDFSPTDLSRLSEQRIDDVALRLAEAVDPHLVELLGYGITAAELTEMNDAAEAYDAGKTGPDVKRAERTGLTATLQPLLAETSELLREQLDKLLARYKETEPVFHAGYQAARVIIDLRGPGPDDDEEPDPEPEPEPDPEP